MDGTCYTVLLTPTTGYEYQSVDDWRSACGQIGGRLVTINNPKQQQFIAKIIMGRPNKGVFSISNQIFFLK